MQDMLIATKMARLAEEPRNYTWDDVWGAIDTRTVLRCAIPTQWDSGRLRFPRLIIATWCRSPVSRNNEQLGTMQSSHTLLMFPLQSARALTLKLF